MQKARFNMDGIHPDELYSYMKDRVKEILSEIPKWNGEIVNDDEIKRVVKWLLTGEKTSLLVIGGIGCGKSVFAMALARTIAVRNRCPYFLPMDWIAKVAKQDEEIPENVYADKTIVLDDVGTEPLEVNVWGNRLELFNEIIYARYARRQPTIITTNLALEDMRAKYGERIMSRLNEMCDVLVFTGNDLRYDTDNH